MISDKLAQASVEIPVEQKIFNTLENLENAVNLEQPTRVGSLLYWELKLNEKFLYADAIKEFAGTPLKLNPINGGTAIKRFCEAVINAHGSKWNGLELKFVITPDKENECWFVSFYTGKAGEISTDFYECFKFLVSASYQIGIVNHRDGLVISKDELNRLMHESFLLTDREFQQAMADYANRQGYRISQSGGYYFMPMPETSKLYDLKKKFAEFGGRVRITPLIFCNDDDAEEIVSAIGGFYGNLIEDSEKLIFELNLGLYKFTPFWEDFKEACLSSNEQRLKENKISRTVYGRNLIAKLGLLRIQSSPEEYAAIASKIMNGIKPKERVSTSAIRGLADDLLAAEAKLTAIKNTALISKCTDRIERSLADCKIIARKAAEMISDEVADLL